MRAPTEKPLLPSGYGGDTAFQKCRGSCVLRQEALPTSAVRKRLRSHCGCSDCIFFVAEINVNQTIFKTVFTAERNDFTAYLLNNQSQPVGSEMGLGQIQYLIRRAGRHKLGKNFRRMNVFLMPVINLPSEKVPAPPSPNCTFESGLSFPVFQNKFTSFCRSGTGFPLSSIIGLKPASARIKAANIPAGPLPTTTGRSLTASSLGTVSGASIFCSST